MRALLAAAAGLAALAALAACGAAPAGAVVVARLPNESPVAVYRDAVVVSVRVKGGFRLARVHDDGRVVKLPGVPKRGTVFDADVGPDTRGRPIVAYSRCRDEQPIEFDPTDARCELWLHRIGRRGEERVRTASTPGASEFAPAVWRARIAYASSAAGQTRLLTRSRLERRTRMPRVIPGIRRDAALRELALRERRLAFVSSSREAGLNRDEVRLFDLATDRVRTLDVLGGGEGGQRFVGVSFAGPRLGWTTSCFGDPEGCSTRGPVRFRVDRGTIFRDRRRGAHAGWSLARGGFIAVGGGDSELGDEEVFLDPTLRPQCDDGRTARRERTCPVVRARR